MAVSRGARLFPPGSAGREIKMKYFMGDTPLAGLERMMMDPSRWCDKDEPKRSRKERPALPLWRSGKEKK